MNMLEKLLKADVEKVTEKPKKTIEIKRLSDKIGSKFEVTCTALDAELLAEISENNTQYSKNGKIKNVDNFKIGVETVVNGVIEPDFTDKNLLKHFNVITPNDLVKKLFLAGELGQICATISELCGTEVTQNEVDEEIKN